jgi:acyl carrier protein
MVPSHFIILDSLPLTPAGKIDRRSLAARPIERPSATPSRPPSDDLEQAIAEIWKEVLGLDHLGADDNFFDLGGHSMALVQVQRKIKSRLGRDLAVVDLFRTPTIAATASYLAAPAEEASAAASAEAVQQGDERAQRRRALRDRRRSSSPSEVEIEDEAVPTGSR